MVNAAELFELDKKQSKRRKRPALFDAHWRALDGERLGRASRLELREATRIYWQYRAERTA